MSENPILNMIIDEVKAGKNLDDVLSYAGDFERLMSYYWCAMCEVETKFRVLDRQLSLGGSRNPIENIKTRLKSPKSIQGKLERLGAPVTCRAMEDRLFDIAGIRVICSYIDDIYMLERCLLKQDDVRLIKRKDYIAAPKPNGYRSLHLIVEIPVFLSDEKRPVKVEVQLRTIAMESWANLEHRIRYKSELPSSRGAEVARMLKSCADMSHELDMRMQSVRDAVEQEA